MFLLSSCELRIAQKVNAVVVYALANLKNDELVQFLIIALLCLPELLLTLAVPLLAHSVWVEWRDEWELPGEGDLYDSKRGW